MNYQIQNLRQGGNNIPVAVTLGHGVFLQLRTVCVSHTALTDQFPAPTTAILLCGRRIALSLRGFTKATAVWLVIEGHPHFPLVAVSGIDTTVKGCVSCLCHWNAN